MAYNLKSIKKQFKQKGIFYTPPALSALMQSYVNITPSSVYDPTCGDGSLLSVFPDSLPKFGQEINPQQLLAAQARLKNFTGVCADTLTAPAFSYRKFDLIMANPPFSIHWEPFTDSRFAPLPVLPPPSKADFAFLAHILHYMACGGMAVVLCFPGILYRGQREGKIRQWLVRQKVIERVVAIPGGYFVDTAIPTCLLILRKDKTHSSIIFEDKQLKKERTVSNCQLPQRPPPIQIKCTNHHCTDKKVHAADDRRDTGEEECGDPERHGRDRPARGGV